MLSLDSFRRSFLDFFCLPDAFLRSVFWGWWPYEKQIPMGFPRSGWPSPHFSWRVDMLRRVVWKRVGLPRGSPWINLLSKSSGDLPGAPFSLMETTPASTLCPWVINSLKTAFSMMWFSSCCLKPSLAFLKPISLKQYFKGVSIYLFPLASYRYAFCSKKTSQRNNQDTVLLCEVLRQLITNSNHWRFKWELLFSSSISS